MQSGRQFIQIGVASGVGLYLSTAFGSVRLFARALPGGTLQPGDIVKYEQPLVIPPAMPTAGKIVTKSGKNIRFYEIATRYAGVCAAAGPAAIPRRVNKFTDSCFKVMDPPATDASPLAGIHVSSGREVET